MKIPSASPGSADKNKTGSWRDMKPIIKGNCIKCTMCAKHCPDGAIKVTEKGAEINYDYCKGCGICSTLCPVKIITMEKEKK